MKQKMAFKERVLYLTRAAIIAALYFTLTVISGMLGLDGKALIQVRLSEALCVLPVFTGAAVPGVTLGCFLYNLILGSPIDAVFGTLATLIGVLATRLLPMFKNNIYLASIPTVLANSAIIPFVVAFAYMDGGIAAVPLLVLTVAIGEIISCSLLGTLLLLALKKHRYAIFGKDGI
jgi:uncharacterized membrane protein